MSDAADVSADLAARAAAAPGAPALVAPGGATLDYAGLAASAAQVRDALADAGIARGDVVAGTIGDRALALVALATLPSGCTYAPLSPRFGAAACADLLARLEAKAVLVEAGGNPPLVQAARAAGIALVSIGRVGAAPGAIDVALAHPTASLDRPPRWPARWCYVLATSGTTGRPKLVPQSHAQIIANSAVIAETLALGPRDVSGHVAAGYNGNGARFALAAPLHVGASVLALPEAGVDALVDAMEAGAITFATASFTVWRELLARVAGGRRIAPHGLRFVRIASGALARAEIVALEEALGVPAVTGLGSTEMTIVLHQRLPPHSRSLGSLGVPVAAEARIADEQGDALPAGEVGEIQVRTDRLFDGYLGDAEATAALFVDGWYRTGDLGRVGEGGEFFHVGRIKEIINRGGEKFSPVEIDEALRSLPGVADAASFAFAHRTLGEEIAAAIVASGDAPVREADLLARARAILGPRRTPKRLHFVDALPRNAAGKLLRKSLADAFGAEAADGVTSAADETPLVAAICALWGDALGRDDVGPSSTFASLGGQPESARALIASVRAVFDVSFDEAALGREASTPEGMGNAITRERR